MTWDSTHPELSKLKVLVVDDEQVLRTMIVYSLHAMEIKNIELAVNADEALVKVQTLDDFHLIICDWMMPGMSGR